MAKDFCVYLDAGHGGLDPSGFYVTAPSKMFFHETQWTFHNGGFFYEGVFNRHLTNMVAGKLKNLGIPYLIVSHEYLDLSLAYRAETANWYHRNYKEGIFISNHANSSPNHRARGMEVYTTPGTTKSDRFADLYWNQVNALLGDKIRMREDPSDGDHDKEARFYVLRKTVMPAILVEHLFFDNFEDAKLLMSDFVVEMFAEAQVRAILEFAKTL
ncbi:MAG: N-acetylmuramoyl-L-alanine amidase [Bacteroidetes bacterium]|nr:MAG: N-acetylmuramoyl-L-alanine amidase [Bacteroidota bacterium]